jgi:hypothetical protein
LAREQPHGRLRWLAGPGIEKKLLGVVAGLEIWHAWLQQLPEWDQPQVHQ